MLSLTSRQEHLLSVKLHIYVTSWGKLQSTVIMNEIIYTAEWGNYFHIWEKNNALEHCLPFREGRNVTEVFVIMWTEWLMFLSDKQHLQNNMNSIRVSEFFTPVSLSGVASILLLAGGTEMTMLLLRKI